MTLDLNLCRQRAFRVLSISHPTRPRNTVSQIYATITTIAREITYPRPLRFSHPWLDWLSPPPLGQSLVILTYWVTITLFLTLDAVIHDAYYYERIGFRAAWVSVTQVPLIYLLAGKTNIVGLLFGSSYININWLHRWISRTLFVTATVHGSFFIREWVRADFLETELMMMPMVKYGLGLWAVLAWTSISSLLPLRRLCYEFFVLQHLASAAVFLWLLHTHVPTYAMYNVWMALVFAVIGWSTRWLALIYGSVHARQDRGESMGTAIGYPAKLRVVSGGTTILTIDDVRFSWKAGQHLFLSCSSWRILESHPFTISNLPQNDVIKGPNQIELVIRARTGFTKRLFRQASSSAAENKATITTFIAGPFGYLPTWNTFETLVLISASTGASFTLPVLESLLRDPGCVSRVDCYFIVRHTEDIYPYLQRIKSASSRENASTISLRVNIAVTQAQANDKDVHHTVDTACESPSHHFSSNPSTQSLHARNKDTTLNTSQPTHWTESTTLPVTPAATEQTSRSSFTNPPNHHPSSKPTPLTYSLGRPPITDAIGSAVEASAGETCVVVCAGQDLTTAVRNTVATLSDDRAVHKGTGAQGIYLHVESFGS